MNGFAAWFKGLVRRHGLRLLLLAAVCHVGVVWVLPRLIMNRVMNVPPDGVLSPHNHAVHMPPVDATARRVVMPSPDLLYSVCMYDLSQGPVRVRAHPQLNNYWSLALYAANSDNFWVRNDRQVQGRGIDLWLVADGQTAGAAPQGAEVLTVPSTRGVVLLRVLDAGSTQDAALVERERRTFECTASASAEVR